ncbi:MAG: hypothetical protein V7618_09335 [Rhodoglobus sp.]|tara:strand:- start:1633 stop:2151 length:519 start_codon:yes stop_codon:yes gene_type:complete
MSTTEHDTEHPAVPEANAAHPQSTETRVASRINALTSGLIGVGIGLATGLVIGLAIIPALGNVTGGLVAATQPSPITAAVETCGVETNRWIDVGDKGMSLSMQSLGEESSGAEFGDVFCMLNELDIPDSVLNRIDSTRALDGRQTADWDGFRASWGYHPDNGLDIVIEFERE